jgi:hypothetical protein
VTGCRREQGPISRPRLRPLDLAAQNLELMAQYQQLDVLHVKTTAAPYKRAEQRPHSEVEEGEDHAADPPNPREDRRRHEYWRPSRRAWTSM